MFDYDAIYTDAQGVPIPKPGPLPPNPTIEDKVEWMRARAAYRDKVTDLANESFAASFNQATAGL